MSNHPITPPEDLIHKWEGEWHHHRGRDTYEEFMAKQAAQWGADQELEACCKWVEREIGHGREWNAHLRAARRPKPPTLKEQALALVSHDFSDQPCLSEEGYAIIRRALEALPND
jgi:hypothetical protein